MPDCSAVLHHRHTNPSMSRRCFCRSSTKHNQLSNAMCACRFCIPNSSLRMPCLCCRKHIHPRQAEATVSLCMRMTMLRCRCSIMRWNRTSRSADLASAFDKPVKQCRCHDRHALDSCFCLMCEIVITILCRSLCRVSTYNIQPLYARHINRFFMCRKKRRMLRRSATTATQVDSARAACLFRIRHTTLFNRCCLVCSLSVSAHTNNTKPFHAFQPLRILSELHLESIRHINDRCLTRASTYHIQPRIAIDMCLCTNAAPNDRNRR